MDCQTPVGAQLFSDGELESILIGAAGQPTTDAVLHIRAVGRWVELRETWDYDGEGERIMRGSYRYAVFEASPEAGSEPLLRYELHPFEGGRTREIYGHGSFEHLHVGASRQHVPTGKVSLEDFLGFVLTEGTDLSEGDASRLVGLLKDAEKNASEWREL